MANQKNGHIDPDHIFQEEWELLPALIDATGMLLVIIDENGRIFYFNQASEYISGYTFQEVQTQTLWEVFLSGEEVSAFQNLLQELRGRHTQTQNENTWRTKDGSLHRIAWTNFALRSQHGGISFIISAGHDITEHKQAELMLHKSEVRSQALLKAIPDLMFRISRQGVFLDYYAARANDLYLAPEVFINQPISTVLPPEVAQVTLQAIEKALETGKLQSYEYTLFIHGQNRYYESRLVVSGENEALVIVREITENKQSEKVQHSIFRISEAAIATNNLQDLYPQIHAIVSDLMPASSFYLALYNPVQATISFPYYVDENELKCSETRPLSDGLTEYIIRHKKSARLNRQGILDLVARGESSLHGPLCVEWLGVPMRIGETVIGVLAVQTYDDTVHYTQNDLDILEFVSGQVARAIERKRTEEALRLSESRYRSLVEASPDAVVLTNLEGVILFVNQPAAALFGFEQAEDLIGRTGFDFLEHKENTKAQKRLKTVQKNRWAIRGEYNIFTCSGERKQIELNARFVRDTDGNPQACVGVVRDITERIQRERERKALNNLATSLRTAQNSQETISTVLDHLQELLETDLVALAIHTPGNAKTVFEQARGGWASVTGQSVSMPSHPAQSLGIIVTQVEPRPSEEDRPHDQAIRQILPQAKNILGVSLVAQGQMIGSFWIGRDAPFSDSEQRVLTAVGDIAASAMHRAMLLEETQRRLQRLTSLRTVDMTITASMDLRVVLNVLLDQLTTQLNVSAADILLYRPKTQTLEFFAGHGFRNLSPRRTVIRIGEGITGQAALERRRMYLTDMEGQHPDFLHWREMPTEGFSTYHVVPLLAKGHIKGVLETFHRTPPVYDREWIEFMETMAGQAAIAIDNATLFENLERSKTELELAYDTTLEGWVRTLDLHDQETEGHTRRVTEMAVQMGRAMGYQDSELVHVRRGALLHDIGKMAVPDYILKKPGPLTKDEWQIMRLHPVHAHELLSPIIYLRPALDIPYAHHEKWDGTGYPLGLKGDEIPLAARLFAIIDVWDALCSDRPYRKGWSLEKVIDYIQQENGKHFDPMVVPVFLRLVNGTQST